MDKIRPITITVASISFIVFGLVNIFFAVLVGVAFWSATNLSAEAPILLGGSICLIVVLGILDTLAGYGLWHMKRLAAIMGMLLTIFGMIFQNFYSILLGQIYYSMYPYGISYDGISYVGYGSALVYLVLVFLIAISWRSFEPSVT
jgi:hypothetical protein